MVLLNKKLNEDFIFYHILEFLKTNDWNLIGGEPPDGTSDDVQRIVIRDSKSLDNSKNKNTQKIDLMAIKSGILLLIELKPSFDMKDKEKLDNLVSNKIFDVFNAIEERTEIRRENIIECVKCLGFANFSEYPKLNDFSVFLVDPKGVVELKKGTNMSQWSI